MKRFVTSEVRVKALFLDGADVAEEAIAMGNGVVTVTNNYLTAEVRGTQKTLGSDQVLFIDENGKLDVMERSPFPFLIQRI